ncbi:peptidyl-tRNA hydrolase [Bimuria novae-zelandiae CBS 107.79]|uniref:Peptidyl-tRNA hydrolase n=1 Tax=Bimuria novae-zelandiae CBS 107.79 TaxID=1447943 RepID=A0A6A5UGE6_9PLEO|nr:peptidyl-tRNA hydrolase [Bimuria novae-zelandiae CBS 107.79]
MGKNALPRAHVSAHALAPILADLPPKNIHEQAAPPSDETEYASHDSDDDEATPAASPLIHLSRKEKRKQKRHANLPTPPALSTSPSSKTPANHPARIPPTLLMRPTPALHSAQKAYPLLICSIGNPGTTYAHTLHSAGHTITTHIASVKSHQPFTKGLSGLVSRPDNITYAFNPFSGFRRTDGGPDVAGDDWTFWQSTSLMNVSGTGLVRAWREFSRSNKDARLVVIHDELESALGKVSVRDGGSSAKGHNGIKSAQASLGGTKWWRVGVGIGRPESREPDVVARYVLRKMSAGEMRAMEKACGSVVAALREIAEGRRN